MPDFAAYKIALKKKYEEEKFGKHSGFLIRPTSAKLRKLCKQILKHGNNANDFQTFFNFFGFPFEDGNSQRLINETDKFRPLATFLTNKTDIADYNSIAADMVAVLVDFRHRPYSNFSRLGNLESVVEEEKNVAADETREEEVSNIGDGKSVISIGDLDIQNGGNVSKHNKLKIASVIIVFLLGGYFIRNYFINQERCMQWQENHYEEVDCKGTPPGEPAPIIPYNENLINFRKIEVCDATQFFKNGKPLVWYCKQNRGFEFFNQPGLHPITQKPLPEITTYIIQKYGLNKKKCKS